MRGNERNTKQRSVILDELQKLTSHPTAAGLYEIVRRRLPRISLGTVYRNLEFLSQKGVVQKLDFGGDEARFDGNPSRHDHVRCLKCGRVADIHFHPLDLSASNPNDFSGYCVSGYRLELLGICPTCQGRSDDPDPAAPEPNAGAGRLPLL